VDVQTAEQMLEACRAALPADVAVCVAAVADWRPTRLSAAKLKKTGAGPPVIALEETSDILAALSAPGPGRPRLTVGFAAETGDLDVKARAKLKSKGCDWIVANDVNEAGVIGGDDNRVTVFDSQGSDPWARTSKVAVARRLAQRIAEALA
jgi:phosphopantothenoylcysteine decarboxylase/phosphopantothenate--cysteine ligase